MSTVEPPNPLPPHKSVGGILLILTCVLTFFTIVTTVLRIRARYARQALGWDDYMIAVCSFLAIIRTSVQIVSVQHGNGRHRWYLSEADYQYINFLTWLTQLLLFTNIGLLKCSICILILRIKKNRALRWYLYVMMTGLVLTNLLPIVVLLAQCNPPSKYWKPKTPGKCWPTKVRIYSIYLQVAYSVFTDLVCALLPIVVVWKVKISTKTKIGVSCLMSLGLIATAVAIVRASSLGTRTLDLSSDYCMAAIWANTELHLGIIATNLSLGRMIWATLLRCDPKAISSDDTPQYDTWTSLSKLSQGYGGTVERDSRNAVEIDPRKSTGNFSNGSQIPLNPMITRSSSVRVSSILAVELSKDTLSADWNCQNIPGVQDAIQPAPKARNMS